jgi:hypothetical protein
MAARSGSLDTVKTLLKAGYEINARDQLQNTPLHYAIVNGHLEVAKFLIDKGADINVVNGEGKSPIHMAALALPAEIDEIPSAMPLKGVFTSSYGIRTSPFTGKFEFHHGIDIAAEVGEKIYATADGRVLKDGWTGDLGRAVIIEHSYGYVTVFGHCNEVFVKRNGRVKKGDCIGTVGKTGLATGNHLHFGMRLNGLSINPYPHLHRYAVRKNTSFSIDSVMRLLVDSKANINAYDYSGRTPLQYAVLRDLPSTQLLIDLGAAVNVRDYKGLSPLHYAVFGNPAVIQYLLNCGAYVNARTAVTYTAENGKYYSAGATPLAMAMENESRPVAELLMKYGGRE